MSCTRPQCYVVPFGGGRPRRMNEDYEIGYIPGFGRIVYLPCGKCIACRRERRQELTVLQCLEASLYRYNWFVTLTYDDMYMIEHDGIPAYSLNRDHLSKFNEVMRKYLSYHGKQYRYFACGEYGEHTERPHYHLTMFGLDPSALGLSDQPITEQERYLYLSRGELRFVGFHDVDENGNPYWQSKVIADRWPYGMHKIYRANRETMQYVAGYVTKKLYSDRTKEIKRSGRSPEFQAQSRPSIGWPWYCKYGHNLSIPHEGELVNDCIEISGIKWKPPRIFGRWMEAQDQFDGPRASELLKGYRQASVNPLPDRKNLKRLDDFDLYSFDRRFKQVNKKNEV